MNEAVGQYKGWPRVVREMATHFLNSTLVENKLKLMTEKSENKSVPFYWGIIYIRCREGRSFSLFAQRKPNQKKRQPMLALRVPSFREIYLGVTELATLKQLSPYSK